MKIPVTIFTAGIVVLLFSGSTVSAKDPDVVQLQVDVAKLQRTVQALQDSLDAKNAALASQMGKMADQVNIMSENLRLMTVLVGTIKTDNAAASASSTKTITETRDVLVPLIAQLARSMGELKEGQKALEVQTKAISDQLLASKSTSTPLAGCKDLKQDADRSFNSGYWEDAVTGYREFVSTCAGDSKAVEVQFQIAESYFNLKKFDLAVQEYDIFYQKYPANDKTASALLRKGLAHAELKQITEARAALTKVTTDFKGTSEAANAAAKLKELGSSAGAGARGTGRGQ